MNFLTLDSHCLGWGGNPYFDQHIVAVTPPLSLLPHSGLYRKPDKLAECGYITVNIGEFPATQEGITGRTFVTAWHGLDYPNLRNVRALKTLIFAEDEAIDLDTVLALIRNKYKEE